MSWQLSRLMRRSGTMILLVLTVAATLAFAAVSHLVTRYTLNQQARGRKLYAVGLTAAQSGHYDDAIAAFRAALTCDPANSQYQLSLARALRDSNDPRRLEEAESYLIALWQRTPQDAAVNLALARVAGHRGSVEDATRYYHNAMYGVWNSAPDANRNRARVELIQFLLKEGARAQADSELIALSTALPPDPEQQLQAARLFEQAGDYTSALARYEDVIHTAPLNTAALAGAGETAYRSGNYALAQHFLRLAVSANPDDANSRYLLASAETVLKANPFGSHISDVERNRRIAAAYTQAELRLTNCAAQAHVDLKTAAPIAANYPASPLPILQTRWLATRPDLARLHSPAETDLPDTIMDVVFQIEQQTANICGSPQGLDEALLLISQKREAANQ